jgi:hypothetical protein
MKHVLTFHKNGKISTLESKPEVLPLAELGQIVDRRRVSHIRPEGIWKWLVFIALRKLFGDDGMVAAWTRTWPGPWMVTIIGSDQVFVDQDRDVCLAWEHAELNQ